MSPEAEWETQVTTLLQQYTGLTRRRYQDALSAFHTWYVTEYQHTPDAALLTVAELAAYRTYLSVTRGLKAATVNLQLAALRALLRTQGRSIKLKGVALEPPAAAALNESELAQLLAAVAGPRWQDKRDGALLALLARAGLRLSEVVALTLSAVRLEAQAGALLVPTSAGRAPRQVPLSAEARAALTAYLEVRPAASQTPELFLTRSWGPLTTRDAQRIITEAARRAGIEKKVTPHVLRHTFATRFLQKGGDLATLATLLGHSSVATTTRYLHPDAGRVQEMVEEL